MIAPLHPLQTPRGEAALILLASMYTGRTDGLDAVDSEHLARCALIQVDALVREIEIDDDAIESGGAQ